MYKKILMLGALSFATTAVYADACDDFLALSIPNAEGAAVELTECSIETDPVDHLKIKGTIDADTSDTSVIIFQMRLPDDWNGRFFMGGDGGFAGDEENEAFITSPVIFTNFGAGGTAIERGYAIATTDTGHQGGDGSWALDDVSFCESPGAQPCTAANETPGAIDNEREINYYHRAVHLTAVAAKSVIHEHYEASAQYSYFHGCSNGGRQGLVEATLYPDDFDGIISGAPAGATELFTNAVYNAKTMSKHGGLTEDKVQLLHSIVLEKCDEPTDGIPDGIINDPRQCTAELFNVARDLPKCSSVDESDCFTSKERLLIKTLYQGPPQLNTANEVQNNQNVGSEGGIEFLPDELLVGWPNWITGSSEPLTPLFGPLFGGGYFSFFIFDDPSFDYEGYVENTSLPQILKAIESVSLTVGGSLNDYRDAGGKILFYQGWNDPAITGASTIGYYERMTELAGGDSSDFSRLYMMPGMAHCLDGIGPQLTDMASALINWVEMDQAPNEILAASFLGFLRPVCPYPQVAQMIDAQGDPYNFLNFECVMP